MQISATPPSVRPHATTATPPAPPKDTDKATAPPLTAMDIYADYDMTAISPREIDELSDRLRAAGVYEFKEMMMLETRGERFMSHLHDSLRSAGIVDDVPYDATGKFDALAQFAHQIEMARRAGDPTEYAQQTLDFLTRVQEAHEQRSAALAPPPAAHAAALFGLTLS